MNPLFKRCVNCHCQRIALRPNFVLLSLWYNIQRSRQTSACKTTFLLAVLPNGMNNCKQVNGTAFCYSFVAFLVHICRCVCSSFKSPFVTIVYSTEMINSPRDLIHCCKINWMNPMADLKVSGSPKGTKYVQASRF